MRGAREVLELWDQCARKIGDPRGWERAIDESLQVEEIARAYV